MASASCHNLVRSAFGRAIWYASRVREPSALQVQLANALDELATFVVTTPRRRSPVEVPLEQTHAYVAFLAACTFASLRDHARARAAADRAREMLADFASDPMQRFLIAAFGERLAQATAGESWDAPLSLALVAQYEAVAELYYIDTIRTASRILEPRPGTHHALEGFDGREDELPEDAAIVDLEARAERLAEIVDLSVYLLPQVATRVLELAADLSEAHAIPIIVRAVALVEGDVRVHARALGVAARLGWGELVLELVTPLGQRLAGERAEPIALSTTIRALRHLGMVDELALLLSAIRDDTPWVVLACAGGWDVVGEARGATTLAEHARSLQQPMPSDARLLLDRLDSIRSVANGYAHASVEHGLHGLRGLAPLIGDVTDSLVASSHFCLSVMHFAESLFYGIAGLDFDRQGWFEA